MLDLKKLKNDLIELIRRSGDDLMSKGQNNSDFCYKKFYIISTALLSGLKIIEYQLHRIGTEFFFPYGVIVNLKMITNFIDACNGLLWFYLQLLKAECLYIMFCDLYFDKHTPNTCVTKILPVTLYSLSYSNYVNFIRHAMYFRYAILYFSICVCKAIKICSCIIVPPFLNKRYHILR